MPSVASLYTVADPLPPALTIDTSFLFSAIYANQAAHGRAWPLYVRMVQSGTTAIVCRPLLLIESWQVLKKLAGVNDGPAITSIITDARELMTGQVALFRDPIPKSITAKREYAVKAGERLIDFWLDRLTLARIRLTYRLLDEARSNMMRFGLKSHDAIWLAVAQAAGYQLGLPPALATTDSDFDRVPGLHVWGRST